MVPTWILVFLQRAGTWATGVAAAGAGAAAVGAGGASLIAQHFPQLLAGGLEITAGLLDVAGYLFLLAYMLGWRKGGEKIAICWPLSIILETVSMALWQ
jgi:mannose/fructose/N-acetylgalactosamine-specific phosphotransferase system component IIC